MNRLSQVCVTAMFLVLATMIPSGSVVFAQGSSDEELKRVILDSRFAAQDIVAKAYLGENSEVYEDVAILYMHVKTETYTDREAKRHDDSWNQHPIEDDLYFFWDFASHRFRAFQFRTTHGGITETSEILYRDETAYRILPLLGVYRAHEMRLDSIQGVEAHGFHAWLDIVAPLTPAMWKKMRSGVAYVGPTTVEGREMDVIEAPWPASPRRPRYYIDRRSSQISMALSYFPDPIDGDIATLIRYIGRKEINGLPVPASMTVDFSSGWRENRVIEDIRALKELPDDFFDLSDTLNVASDQWEIVEISTRLRLVRNPGIDGFNVHYAILDDSVVVIDTPTSVSLARYLIDLIAAEEPGKPIEYLLLTHGHEQNIAGVREFAANGTTIITSHSSEEFVNRLIYAPGSRLAGTSSREPIVGSVRISVVSRNDPVVIGSGDNAIRVINIGDTPHAEEVLVAVDEGGNSIVTGDVFSLESPGSETSDLFFEWAMSQRYEDPLILGSRHEPIPLSTLMLLARNSDNALLELKQLIESVPR